MKRTVFFTKLEERLNEEVSHPIFGYKTMYQCCLELQVRLLAKFIKTSAAENPTSFRPVDEGGVP